MERNSRMHKKLALIAIEQNGYERGRKDERLALLTELRDEQCGKCREGDVPDEDLEHKTMSGILLRRCPVDRGIHKRIAALERGGEDRKP